MKQYLDHVAREYLGLLSVLVGLIVLFSLKSEHFFSLITFTTLANQLPTLTVIAVGMTFVLIVAGIDLSVGSVMAFSGTILGVALLDAGLPLFLACFLCLCVGLICGIINGLICTRWAIPSFIVTLGMLEIARGGAYLATGSQTKYIGNTVETLSAPLPWIDLSPALLISVLVVICAQLVLSRTVFGRYMIAIGSNEEAVRLSGINVRFWKLLVFAISGLLAGLGGLFHVAYLQSADPNAGIGLELAAIAAVVIGGTRLSGGMGSVINTFLGVVIISVLQTGLAQLGVSEPSKRVITGLVIIIAVVLDVYRNRDEGVGNFFTRLLKR
jgi:ribose transport system permease protein